MGRVVPQDAVELCGQKIPAGVSMPISLAQPSPWSIVSEVTDLTSPALDPDF